MHITNLDGEIFIEVENNFNKFDLNEFFSIKTTTKIKTLLSLDNQSLNEVNKDLFTHVLDILAPDLLYWIKDFSLNNIQDNSDINSHYLNTINNEKNVKKFIVFLNEFYKFNITEVIRFNNSFYVSFDEIFIPSPFGYSFSFLKLKYNLPKSILVSSITKLISFEAIALMFSQSMYTSLTEDILFDKMEKRLSFFSNFISYQPEEDPKLKLKKNLKKYMRRRMKKTYLMYDRNNGYFKIGNSINPKYREKTLQSEKPSIVLYATCDSNIEHRLHMDFKDKRIRGEWFDLNTSDLLSIRSIFDQEPNCRWGNIF